MNSPKFRPPVANKEDEGSCFNLRCCLLIWAFMRLVVSLFWSGLFIFNTYDAVKKYTSGEYSPLCTRLRFDILAILIQLVESVMIVIFISAGIKKSFRLYRAYYRYCILTLIIYVIAVGVHSLNFSNGHYFVGFYITFLLSQLWDFPVDYTTVFKLLAAGDVVNYNTITVPYLLPNYYHECITQEELFLNGQPVLEVLLIFLIRKLMKIYSFKSSETV